jgi:hypothetical protein
MTEFDRHVRDYLRMRRALGFKLRREGQLLVQLAGYLERAGAEHLNTELALRWAHAGHRITIGSRDEAKAKETALELNAILGRSQRP